MATIGLWLVNRRELRGVYGELEPLPLRGREAD